MQTARRLAFAMCRRMPAHVSVQDLISAGHEGLVMAMAGYDPAKGSFASYARSRIKHAMLDELRTHDPLTRHARTCIRRRDRETLRLRGALGRRPDDDEVAEALGLPLMLHRRHVAEQSARSELDAEACADPSTVPIDDQLVEDETRCRLRAAVETLNHRAQRIVTLYYEHGLTQSAIGAQLGVTESRVCQILSHTASVLRKRIEGRSTLDVQAAE